MAKQLNQVSVNLSFSADTSKVKAQLQDLQIRLSNLAAGKHIPGMELGITKDFQEGIKAYPLDAKLVEKIQKLDEFITKEFKITFGNRIMKQINTFVPVYVACGGTDVQGLDYFLAYKVIRKFETLNLSFLHEELNQLITLLDKLFGKNTCLESINCIQNFIKNS